MLCSFIFELSCIQASIQGTALLGICSHPYIYYIAWWHYSYRYLVSCMCSRSKDKLKNGLQGCLSFVSSNPAALTLCTVIKCLFSFSSSDPHPTQAHHRHTQTLQLTQSSLILLPFHPLHLKMLSLAMSQFTFLLPSGFIGSNKSSGGVWDCEIKVQK